jgi:hypothetical protein
MTNPQEFKDAQLRAYEQLCHSYRAIDDFRAKLLGFLPLATGTGLFLLLTEQGARASMRHFFEPIGIFGFVITLGLFFYEIYGIKKCTYLIAAGRKLEEDLGVENGQFRWRPHGIARLIDERFASGVIYPAVMAAWIFLAFAFPQLQDPSPGSTQDPSKIQDLAKYGAILVFVIGLAVSLSQLLFMKDPRRPDSTGGVTE